MRPSGVRSTKLTPTDIEVIHALAEYDLNASLIAPVLYMHRNTVYYHIGHIEAKTGLNPKKFYDLCKLLEMIKEDDAE